MLTPEEKLKMIRKKYNLSQKEVCGSDYNESTLSQIENGRIKLKREKNARYFLTNINNLLKKNGIDDVIDEEWLFESIPSQIKKRINEIIIELYRDRDIDKVEEEVKKIFMKFAEIPQGTRIYFVLANYYNIEGDQPKAKYYYLKTIDYAYEGKNYSILSVAILQVLRLNYYLNENSNSRGLYYRYFDKFKISSKEVEGAIIYNYALAFQCLEQYQLAIDLYSRVPNYTVKEIIKSWLENNTAICLQEMEKYEEALELLDKIVKKTAINHRKLKAYCNIISCCRKTNNKIKCKLTIEKLERMTSLFEEKKMYQVYYTLGYGYSYIGDKENALEAFEKEVSLGIDLKNINFNPIKYLESIGFLLKNYKKTEKSKIIELMKKIEGIPHEMLTKNFILIVLDSFVNYAMYSEVKGLINKFYTKNKGEI